MDRDLSHDLTARRPIVGHQEITGVARYGCIVAVIGGRQRRAAGNEGGAVGV